MVSLPAKMRPSSRFFRFRRRTETEAENPGFRNLWRFMAYMKPYSIYIWGACVAGLLRMLLPLYMPRFLQNVIDRVLIPHDLPNAERFAMLWRMMPLLAALMVVHVLVTLGRVFWGNLIAANVVRDVRYALFDHVQRLSLEFHMQRPTGSILSRLMGDVSSAQNSFDLLFIQGSQNVLQAVLITIYLFYRDWQWALIAFTTVPIFTVTTRLLRARVRAASRQVMETNSRISGHLQERISMIREVQSFTAEDYERRRVRGQVSVLRGYSVRQFFLMAIMLAASEITRYLGLVVIVVFGAYRVLNGHASTGDVTSFYMYIGMLLQPIDFLANLYTNLLQSAIAADRVFEFMDTRSPIQEAPNAQPLDASEPASVRFDDVSFAYPDDIDAHVLQNISFTVSPGERVVLVGGSGSGKSSMMNLLLRFYDVTHGAISINGLDLRLLTTNSLRHAIGIVPQQPILFRGTIRDNIMYGRRDASEEEMRQAARSANAEKFILEMADGYDTVIGERGSRLSGGQAQRIAIARAFLKDPAILIMDEATSNLDAISETLVLEALERLAEGRTTFIIAHRLSVARTANLILVLNKGVIVERGTHTELLSKNGAYTDLWQQQMIGNARENRDAVELGLIPTSENSHANATQNPAATPPTRVLPTDAFPDENFAVKPESAPQQVEA